MIATRPQPTEEKAMNSRRTTPRRRAWAGLLFISTLALASVPPRSARAEISTEDVARWVSWAKQAFGYYGTAISIAEYLIGGNGPTLSQQLNDVKVAIINELRTQRNLAWKEEAQDVFDDFAILGFRLRTDPHNETLRSDAWQLSQGALNYYAGLVEAIKDGLNDIKSAYQLAPTFNSLLVVHTGLTRMRAEITPGVRVPWGEFNIYLHRGMQVNYWLIGVRTVVLCWPGFNPGQGQYAIAEPSNRLYTNKLYTRSQLWKKKGWGTYNYEVPSSSTACDRFICSLITCNYNGVATYPRDCMCLSPALGPLAGNGNACADEAMAWTVDYVQKNKFWVNGVVKIIQAAMGGTGGILKTGGGDDRVDGQNLSLPEQGMMTDPWVDEPLCTNFPGNGGAPNPWAYPIVK
jgi:hypothetical protein